MRVKASLEFDAYRLVQYQVPNITEQAREADEDIYTEKTYFHFGAQASYINSQHAVHYKNLQAHKLAVLHVLDVADAIGPTFDGDKFLTKLLDSQSSGLLIVLQTHDKVDHMNMEALNGF